MYIYTEIRPFGDDLNKEFMQDWDFMIWGALDLDKIVK